MVIFKDNLIIIGLIAFGVGFVEVSWWPNRDILLKNVYILLKNVYILLKNVIFPIMIKNTWARIDIQQQRFPKDPMSSGALKKSRKTHLFKSAFD